MTGPLIVEIKARAFDRMMALLEGRHRVCDQRQMYDLDLPTTANLLSPCELRTHITTRTVTTYEWTLCISNSTDIRQVLMDEAAAELKKEMA